MPSFTWSNAKTLHLIGIPLIWISYGFAVAPQHAIIEAAFNQFHWRLALGSFATLIAPLFGCMLLQFYLFPPPIKPTLFFEFIRGDSDPLLARLLVAFQASSLGSQCFELLHSPSMKAPFEHIAIRLAFFVLLPLVPWCIGMALNQSEFKVFADRLPKPLSD